MGVHHAWGRTLKDVFQRYKALRGFDQRYQNGFDCQGLWVEVEVEKALGLNSKREIEEYGLAEFAARCRERVARYAERDHRRSRKRLGQWMDWDNDYYTFSDTNIEYIWRFLKECHERGWLYKGHRSTQWCPRCGTSLSQHEQAGEENYRELEHPSLFVRFPLADREGEALVVWTTTPWTLPANVAAAVKPDAEYGLTRDGEWRARRASRRASYDKRRPRRGARRARVRGARSTSCRRRQGVEHRVIPWDEVALDEGTGIVHIAPGAGAEDFELSRVHDLPVLAPIDEAGRFVRRLRAASRGSRPTRRPSRSSRRCASAACSSRPGTIVHRYPICWRCKTPLVFRVVDDWFISVRRDPAAAARRQRDRRVDAAAYGKRMDDWLRNMGDWNISRKRYFGLPLPFYPCDVRAADRDRLARRARGARDRRARAARRSSTGPWIDEVAIRCEACDEEVRRIPEVGDAWLDAGIVPLLDARLAEPGVGPRTATRPAPPRGLTGADLPDHAYWEQWFPADWVSEMREQIRLWFYSISVHVGDARRAAAVPRAC